MKKTIVFSFCIVTLLLMCFVDAFASLPLPRPCKHFTIVNHTKENAYFYFKDCDDCEGYLIPPNQSVSDSTCAYRWRFTMIMAAPGSGSENFKNSKHFNLNENVVSYGIYCRERVPPPGSTFTWTFNENRTCELQSNGGSLHPLK